MSRKAEIQKERKKKIRLLRKVGVDPYPEDAVKRTPIALVRKRFPRFLKVLTRVSIAGRIRALRKHGGATFLDIGDAEGQIQALLRKDILGEVAYDRWAELLDIGDFVSIDGRAFLTKRGEETLEARKVVLLAKSLTPLPQYWYGLKDVEERFRKRYLDLLLNKEVQDRFLVRARVIQAIRAFLLSEGFLEVETPILQTIPGGAAARPFQTHLNALDLDLYLRIAPELYLKRLLVGGFEKVFEIGRNFRNEGMDALHNPDFTMMELYWAYQDADGLMRFTEVFLSRIVRLIRKGYVVSVADQKINFKAPFARSTFFELMKKYARIDVASALEVEIRRRAEALGADVALHPAEADLLDAIFKKACLPNIAQPTFVTRYPLALSPLAKALPEDPTKAARFQLVVAGMEIVNAFSELNDPVEQRKRFEEQEKARKKGSKEAQRLDEDYLEALEYGMPPSAGLGLGIDRLVMLLTNAPSLREVILFPTMRPQSKN